MALSTPRPRRAGRPWQCGRWSALAAVALAAASCSSSSRAAAPPVPLPTSAAGAPSEPGAGAAPGPSTPASTEPPATGSASPTASAARTPISVAPSSPPAAASPAPGVAVGGSCASGSLLATLDPGQGAAGTLYQDLRLTNRGPAACTVAGFPGVSFVAGGTGRQVGDPAERTGGPGVGVLLAPGQAATAQLGVANSGTSDPAVCRPQLARGVRVYPPGQKAALFAPFPEGPRDVCSAPGRTSAHIEALQRG